MTELLIFLKSSYNASTSLTLTAMHLIQHTTSFQQFVQIHKFPLFLFHQGGAMAATHKLSRQPERRALRTPAAPERPAWSGNTPSAPTCQAPSHNPLQRRKPTKLASEHNPNNHPRTSSSIAPTTTSLFPTHNHKKTLNNHPPTPIH
jgi:hypothetical protein